MCFYRWKGNEANPKIKGQRLNMKSSKVSLMGGSDRMQLAFSFAAECVKAYVRPAVLSLSRCHKAGADKAVQYAAWLEWASPLASVGGPLDGAWLSNYQAKFGGQSTLWGGK